MPLHLTNQLKRAIQDDPSKCVLFVGAGLSASGVRQGGKGLPDWDTLMQHMIDDLRDSEKCDAGTLAKLEELLREGKHLEIARSFKQRTRPDQFASFLKIELDPPDIASSIVHEVILKTNFRGIITTNFDMIFEYQSNRLQPLVYPQCLDDIDSFRRDGFFAKIHGCIRNTPNPAENLILTEESYAILRSNRKYHTIMRSLFVMNPILTVGFSLRDPDFLGLIGDLREIFREVIPTVYALMLKPEHKARDELREKGVEIIPYTNHAELVGFFEEMLHLTEQKHPIPTVTPVSNETEIHYDPLLEKWQRAQKVEEMHQIVQEQIDRLPNNEQKESFLFRFLALVGRRDEIRLSPHLVAMRTEACERVLLTIFRNTGEGERWPVLKPHPKYLSVYKWVLEHWPKFIQDNSEAYFAWLLDKGWVEHDIDLWETFLSLLNRIITGSRMLWLDHLYDVCQHIEGAPERIEKIVFAPDFVREDDPQHRWFKNWDLQTLESVRYEKFKKAILDGVIPDYKNQLAEAMKMEESLPENVYRSYTEFILNRLFDEYVQRTHLTLHSSSGLYDPEKVHEILEVLADVNGKKRQLTVLWAINSWPERMRGLGSLGEDTKSLREGLFIPLWWRYSSEARIEYLKEHGIHRMHELLWTTGQEFLLEDMMGFTYDIDKDFRDAFNTSLNQHLATSGSYKYEPRPFQEIWRERELSYKLSDEVPPELVRRIAVKRVDWDNLQPGQVRWQEAQERAGCMKDRNFADFVSKEEVNYAIDNLLGAYFPAKVEVVLYPRMIEYAADDMGVDKDSLSTVVYIHETVHAYSHTGKDHDGRSWSDFSLPMSDQPDFHPSKPHEAIAQYYTYKLLETLGDKKLIQAFLTLEQHSLAVYRAWRATEHYTLEEMREILVNCRRRGTEWPPSY
ncbi:MAG TPA: SIR2 family protein [Candidatus Wunengus sp. YC64]|uniref:SIR2 family protein n=1 Tax=Candidatus Wunengus sp. YC64 TaxID=3367700 RepID=UPI0027128178|nr:SIR2 family protein [Candidatus Brocadiales bacterium]